MRSTVYLKTSTCTYFIAISVERASSTLDLCFGRSSSRIGLSTKSVILSSETMLRPTCITVVKPNVFLRIQIKVAMNSISPSKFPTMCFTQSSVSSGTVARLLWRGSYTKVSGLFTTKSWNKMRWLVLLLKKIITVTMVKIMMMRVTVVMTTLVVYY